MSVYVHPLMACVTNHKWRWRESTHMVADDINELHAFAKKIGLRRAWFQQTRLDHYDLNPARYAAAVKAGAVVLTLREFRDKFLVAGPPTVTVNPFAHLDG